MQLHGGGAVEASDRDAEERVPEALQLFAVAAEKALGELVVVSSEDDARVGIPAKPPARERLRDGHALAVLRRRLDEEHVVGMARVRFQKRLHAVGEIAAHGRLDPRRAVDIAEIIPEMPPRELPAGELRANQAGVGHGAPSAAMA